MSNPAHRLGAAYLALALAPAVSLATQDRAPESGYGTDDLQVVTIPFSRFQPLSSGTFSSSCCVGVGGERWPTAGTEILAAEIDAGLVPNGATIEEVRFYIEDTDNLVNHNFRGNLCRAWVDLDGTNSDGDCPVAVTSSCRRCCGAARSRARPGAVARRRADRRRRRAPVRRGWRASACRRCSASPGRRSRQGRRRRGCAARPCRRGTRRRASSR